MTEKQICPWYPVCPIKRYTEKNMIDKKWVEQYCKSEYWRCVRKKMEEKGEYHPDNMMPDGTIDDRLL